MSALVARAVVAGYGARTVLLGIDLAPRAGEVTALVGPNGAGKSTLLRALAGLVRPTAGAVTLDGTDVGALGREALARRVAVVPQVFDTLFPFTVREIVGLGRTSRLGLLARPTADDGNAIERALAASGIAALADRRIDSLSGGERQLTVLAMALAQETDVLLLDEPTTHLDPAHQLALVRRLRSLAADRGATVVAVLHDLNLAALADRVVVVSGGAIVADDGPAAALGTAVGRSVFGDGLRVIPVEDRVAIVPAGR